MRVRPRLLVLLLAVLLGAPAVPTPAWADDGPRVTVPDVRRRRVADARRALEAAGLTVGDVFEFSVERILRTWKVRGVVGTVFLQRPTPGIGWPKNKPIDLVVVSAKDGKMPAGLKARNPKPAVPAKSGDDTPATPGGEGAPVAPPGNPTPGSPAPGSPAPGSPVPGPDAPRKAPPKIAEGSPDAPRVAPKPDPNRVPELIGLDLADAEHLVRESQMKLHVERVAGHPIGRVLEQVPAAGAPRPAAGMLKVVVTAGGDFESRMPGAPAVYLAEIAVPGLLDRTQLQAERILAALGLKVETAIAKRGLAGRVVDQLPAAGGKVAKGGLVRLWIGPGAKKADEAGKPPPFGPLGAGTAPKPDAPAKKGAHPLPEGPLKAGVPQPVSPSVNTPIPVGAKVPVGFTWRGVTGANAYLLEVEEQGAEGRWLPLARKPARTTAVLLDVERFDDRGAARLRWRVTAMISGRQGTPSAWVLLR